MRKLPVGKAVENCLRSVVAYSPEAAKIGLPWIVIVIILGIAQAILIPDNFLDPEYMVSSAEQGDYSPFIIMFFDIAVYLFALSSIAVNWHRFALLEEMPSRLKWLRIDSLTVRYFGNLMLTLILVIIPGSILLFGVIALAANAPEESVIVDIILIGGTVAMTLAVAIIFSVLTLRLPAIAINAPSIGFLSTFNIVKGNYTGLIGYSFALAICLAIVRFVASLVDKLVLPYGGIVGYITSFVMDVAVLWFCLMVGVATITTLFGYFVEKRDFEDASEV